MKSISLIILLVLMGMADRTGNYGSENVVRPAARTDLKKFEWDPQGAANKERIEMLKTLEWNGYAVGFMRVYALFLASVLGIVLWRSASLQGIFRMVVKLKSTLYNHKLIIDSTRALTSFFMV